MTKRRYTRRVGPPTPAQIDHWKNMRAIAAGKTADRVDPRREKVRLLAREGRSDSEIADIIGISQRTVERDKRALGLPIRVVEPYRWSAQAHWLARNLIEDGCPVNEIARSLGCTIHVVTFRFRAEIEARGQVEIIGGRHHQMAVELGLRLTDARAVI